MRLGLIMTLMWSRKRAGPSKLDLTEADSESSRPQWGSGLYYTGITLAVFQFGGPISKLEGRAVIASGLFSGGDSPG